MVRSERGGPLLSAPVPPGGFPPQPQLQPRRQPYWLVTAAADRISRDAGRLLMQWVRLVVQEARGCTRRGADLGRRQQCRPGFARIPPLGAECRADTLTGPCGDAAPRWRGRHCRRGGGVATTAGGRRLNRRAGATSRRGQLSKCTLRSTTRAHQPPRKALLFERGLSLVPCNFAVGRVVEVAALMSRRRAAPVGGLAACPGRRAFHALVAAPQRASA